MAVHSGLACAAGSKSCGCRKKASRYRQERLVPDNPLCNHDARQPDYYLESWEFHGKCLDIGSRPSRIHCTSRMALQRQHPKSKQMGTISKIQLIRLFSATKIAEQKKVKKNEKSFGELKKGSIFAVPKRKQFRD